MACAQVRVGRQGLTGGMPGAGCVTDVLIRTVCTGMRGSLCGAGVSGRQGAGAMDEGGGRGKWPGNIAGEVAWGDGRGRPQEEVGGAGRGEAQQGTGVEPVRGEGQRLSACQMAAQGPAWFMV